MLEVCENFDIFKKKRKDLDKWIKRRRKFMGISLMKKD